MQILIVNMNYYKFIGVPNLYITCVILFNSIIPTYYDIHRVGKKTVGTI